MASSSYNPLAAAPEPLKPSGGGRGLGGAQPLVAHADEDAEEDIVDSQPDPYLDAATAAHQKELDSLSGELGGLLPQYPTLAFSQAPRVSSKAGSISKKRVEGDVPLHLNRPHAEQIESHIAYVESEYTRLHTACGDNQAGGTLSVDSFPSVQIREQIYARARLHLKPFKFQAVDGQGVLRNAIGYFEPLVLGAAEIQVTRQQDLDSSNLFICPPKSTTGGRTDRLTMEVSYRVRMVSDADVESYVTPGTPLSLLPTPSSGLQRLWADSYWCGSTLWQPSSSSPSS